MIIFAVQELNVPSEGSGGAVKFLSELPEMIAVRGFAGVRVLPRLMPKRKKLAGNDGGQP